MILGFILVLDLFTQNTIVGTQTIDGLTLNIYGIVIVIFFVENKLREV